MTSDSLLALRSHRRLNLLQTHHLPPRSRPRRRPIALLSLVCADFIGCRSWLLRRHTPQARIDLEVRNVTRITVLLIACLDRFRRDLWRLGGNLSGLRHRVLSAISKLFFVDSIRDLRSLTEEVKVLADFGSLCCSCSLRCWAPKRLVIERIVRLVQLVT